jgi:hypothetical protein
MHPARRNMLRKAYHLIKAGDPDAARALIKPVLAAERDNIDAWWLAAHAAATSTDRRLALGQVLRLNPDHGPARQMLDQLNAEHPEEIDEIAQKLPLKEVRRDARRASSRSPGMRWLWNIVLIMGCLSTGFGSLALVSGFLGLAPMENLVDEVAENVGLKERQGQQGEFGTIKGGDPYAPYDIPVTVNKGAKLGSDSPNLNQLEEDEAHIYTFAGQRGQEVVALLQFTVAGDARYVIELWDANKQRLATGTGELNSGTVTLVYTLRQSGNYALVVIGRPGGPQGDYFLGIDLLD